MPAVYAWLRGKPACNRKAVRCAGSGILCQTEVCCLPVPWPCAASLDSVSLPCWRPMIRWVNSPTSMIFAGAYLMPPSLTRNLRAQRCCHVLFPVFNLGKACVWTKKPQTRVPKTKFSLLTWLRVHEGTSPYKAQLLIPATHFETSYF